ncbi:Conserved membrane protein [Lachnospiraceae bacterium TWA4]|nr:Conserved membrane protein [Lachnospiraceae bacterium TWA4]
MISKLKQLTNLHLKYIAMLTMLIDHIGYVFLGGITPYYQLSRAIGRIAFPLYCFMLVEGYLHTHDFKNYALRLGILAIISEIPFNLMVSGQIFHPEYQNVIVTLLLGLFAIKYIRYIFPSILCVIAAYFSHTDYGAYGVLLIIAFYLDKRFIPSILMICKNPWMLLSMIPISLYNGEKGSSKLPSIVYYAFYPVHMFILSMIYLLW